MGYVVEGIAYVGGALMIGAGLFLVMRGSFPGWWRQRFAWPLVHVTRRVAQLQGVAAIAVGASVMLVVFTTVAPASVGGILVLVAIAAYSVAVGLYGFSTWLSRRPAAG